MILDKIKEIIIENLNCEEALITLEAALIKDLGMDSLDAVELSMALEEEFDLTIEEDALTGFVTIGDIVTYIERNQ